MRNNYIVRSTLITVSNATFEWKDTMTKRKIQQELNQVKKFKLTVEKFSITKGKIFGITGQHDSGKTTFLYSLIGHTIGKKISESFGEGGSIKQHCEIGFFPQTIFIVTGSIKDNIVMKSKFDASR